MRPTTREVREYFGLTPLTASTTYYISEQRSTQAEEQPRDENGQFTEETGIIIPTIETGDASQIIINNITTASEKFAAETGFDQTVQWNEHTDTGYGQLVFRYYDPDLPEQPGIVMTRTINSPTSMYHGGMAMRNEYLTQGHANKLNTYMEDAYRESMIEIIQLDSDSETGPYGHALQGYDFDTTPPTPQTRLTEPFSTQQFITAARTAMTKLYGSDWRTNPEATRQYESFEETLTRMTLDPSTRPIPLDYATLGYTQGATTWLGKEMLTGPHAPKYRAIKRL